MNTHQTCVVKFMSPLSIPEKCPIPRIHPIHVHIYVCVCVCVCVYLYAGWVGGGVFKVQTHTHALT